MQATPSSELAMSALGTSAWSRRTGGKLSPADRWRLDLQLIVSRIGRLAASTRRRLGLDDRLLAQADSADLGLPDCADARRTLEHARFLLPGWLLQHSLRTYAWGSALARSRRVAYDRELLFVAAALHDLALAEPRRACASPACFAARGAASAGRFADSLGWAAERRQRLEDAISLHLNVRVPLAAGAEAHLLHAGAALDCIGTGLAEIAPQTVQQILDRYPRQGFKSRIADALETQARTHESTRTGFLLRLGFSGLIQSAPFPE